jgi:hypothetical protein
MNTDRLDKIHRDASTLCSEVEALTHDTDDTIELSYALAKVRETKRVLSDLDRDIAQKIVALSDERKFDVEGVGRFEIKGGRRNTQWRKDEVVREFVRAYTDEHGVPGSRGELMDLFTVFADCVSIGGAKVAWTELTGVEFDEVSHQEDAAKSVAIFTPDSAPRIEGF